MITRPKDLTLSASAMVVYDHDWDIISSVTDVFANFSRVIGTFFAAIAMIYLTVTSLRKSMTAPYAGQTTFEWRLVASPVRHIGSHPNPRACGNWRISANGGRLTTTRTKQTNYFSVN